MKYSARNGSTNRRGVAIVTLVAAVLAMLVGGLVKANFSNAAETMGNTCATFPRPPQDPECNAGNKPPPPAKVIPVVGYNITEDRALGARGGSWRFKITAGGTNLSADGTLITGSVGVSQIGTTVGGNILTVSAEKAFGPTPRPAFNDIVTVPVGAVGCHYSVLSNEVDATQFDSLLQCA